MKLFVSSLTGPTLMWYTQKDTRKWVCQNNLVSDFIGRFYNKLKRKFIARTLTHNKVGLVETQLSNKRKTTINEVSRPSKFKVSKSKAKTLLYEPPSITFEILRSHDILQPKLIDSYFPSSTFFDPKIIVPFILAFLVMIQIKFSN